MARRFDVVSYASKDHQLSTIVYDPIADTLIPVGGVSADVLGGPWNAVATCPVGGWLDGLGYILSVDEVTESNSYGSDGKFWNPIYADGSGRQRFILEGSNGDEYSELYIDTSGHVATNLYGYTDEESTWSAIEIDHKTNSLVSITEEHHKIHEGTLYTAYRNDTLATNDTIGIAWTTPDTALEGHIRWSVDVGGECIVDIVESVTSYTGGTAFTPVNRNRRSVNTSGFTVKIGSNGALADSLVLTGGTTINENKVGSGKVASGTGLIDEWILKRNAITVLRLKAVANNISCGLRAYWYEVTP